MKEWQPEKEIRIEKRCWVERMLSKALVEVKEWEGDHQMKGDGVSVNPEEQVKGSRICVAKKLF